MYDGVNYDLSWYLFTIINKGKISILWLPIDWKSYNMSLIYYFDIKSGSKRTKPWVIKDYLWFTDS